MNSYEKRPLALCCPARRRSRGDEAELFRRHQRRLLRSVQAAVGGRRDLAEDGCAFAWAQLVANQPERGERLFGWLRKVAVHEAWRLAKQDSREGALEDFLHDASGAEWEALLGVVSLDDQLAVRDALSALASLRARERRYLELKVSGHSYREIQQICGGRSYNYVISGRWCHRCLLSGRMRRRHVAEGGQSLASCVVRSE